MLEQLSVPCLSTSIDFNVLKTYRTDRLAKDSVKSIGCPDHYQWVSLVQNLIEEIPPLRDKPEFRDRPLDFFDGHAVDGSRLTHNVLLNHSAAHVVRPEFEGQLTNLGPLGHP